MSEHVAYAWQTWHIKEACNSDDVALQLSSCKKFEPFARTIFSDNLRQLPICTAAIKSVQKCAHIRRPGQRVVDVLEILHGKQSVASFVVLNYPSFLPMRYPAYADGLSSNSSRCGRCNGTGVVAIPCRTCSSKGRNTTNPRGQSTPQKDYASARRTIDRQQSSRT